MGKSYGKLVRDKIPEIIKNNGEEPIIRILNLEEYKKALEEKLLEECNEVLESSNKERLEELADLFEVAISLAKLENSSIDEILKLAKEKEIKRGSFNKRIFLETVIEKNN